MGCFSGYTSWACKILDVSLIHTAVLFTNGQNITHFVWIIGTLANIGGCCLNILSSVVMCALLKNTLYGYLNSF